MQTPVCTCFTAVPRKTKYDHHAIALDLPLSWCRDNTGYAVLQLQNCSVASRLARYQVALCLLIMYCPNHLVILNQYQNPKFSAACFAAWKVTFQTTLLTAVTAVDWTCPHCLHSQLDTCLDCSHLALGKDLDHHYTSADQSSRHLCLAKFPACSAHFFLACSL